MKRYEWRCAGDDKPMSVAAPGVTYKPPETVSCPCGFKFMRNLKDADFKYECSCGTTTILLFYEVTLS